MYQPMTWKPIQPISQPISKMTKIVHNICATPAAGSPLLGDVMAGRIGVLL